MGNGGGPVHLGPRLCVRGTSPLSAFVLDKCLEAAAETLADRRSFVLSAKQYDAFVAALDAAPKSRPRLERLFAEPSVLE